MSQSKEAPRAGDIIIVEFTGAEGGEQRGRRPCLVISQSELIAKTGFATLMPITSVSKGYPMEVEIAIGATRTPSWVLSDQVKTIDWRARGFEKKGRVDPAALGRCRHNISLALGIQKR